MTAADGSALISDYAHDLVQAHTAAHSIAILTEGAAHQERGGA